jgi:hypothetical protein
LLCADVQGSPMGWTVLFLRNLYFDVNFFFS